MSFARSVSGAFMAAAATIFACVAAHANPMTFRTVPVGEGCGSRCAQMIIAQGEITLRTPDDFVAFVRRQVRNPNARGVILLDSQGGRVGAAMQLGKLFRQAGAAVIVGRSGPDGILPGGCYSACVYALVGAKKRVIPKVSRVGIHRMVAFERDGGDPDVMPHMRPVYATPDLVKRLSDYVGSMGVSRELINTAERVSHDRLRIITPQEIRRWKLGSEKF
jgi:hypothetical protein